MNALDLPPRRALPDETRDRIRRSVDTGTGIAPRRSRAPLAAAAAVVVLAAGAIAVATWGAGHRDQRHPAGGEPAGGEPAGPVIAVLPPDARTDRDLDHCADVAAANGRADDFAPRPEWRADFTATAQDGTRITAFLGSGDRPAFCEVTATTATVSDPVADPVPLATTPTNMSPASVYAVYLSPAGVLAGYAEGVDALEFSAVRGGEIEPVSVPAFRDGVFVVNLGEFRLGDSVDVIGRSSQGLPVVSGSLAHNPPRVPPAGVTGRIG